MLEKTSVVIYDEGFDLYIIYRIYIRSGAKFPTHIDAGEQLVKLYKVNRNNTPFYRVVDIDN